MALVVESFAGTDINTSAYSPRLHAGDAIESMAISPVVVRPAGKFGRFLRSDVQAKIIPVHVTILSGGDDAGQIALAQIFTRGITGELVVTYNGTSRALTCRVERTILYDKAPNQFTAVLVSEDPMWHSTSLQTVTQNQTSSGATWAVANDGNAADYNGIFTVQTKTAKATADGYLYKREYIIANRVARPFNNYALMFQFDHAALTTTKSLASGNDVRVRVDGVEVPRWASTQAAQTWDQTTTEVWFNLTLSPAKTATLLTAFASGASPANGADCEVVKGGTSGWPTSGAFVIDNEVVSYTGISLKNSNGREAFTGITRGARTSTAAAHSAAAVLYWVERRVQILYGYSGASAPDARDELKPMLDLTSATLTNTQHEWLDFADSANPLRSMQWGRKYVTTRDDQPDKIISATGAPAASMSMVYNKNGASVGSPVFNQWQRDVPSGTDGNIAPTRVVDASMALQYITVDADGNEVLGTEANDGLQLGPLTSAADAHDPGDSYGIHFWAFNQTVGASPTHLAPLDNTGTVIAAAVGTIQGQQFTTGSEPITIKSISIRVQDDSSARAVTIGLSSNQSTTSPVGTSFATTASVNTGGAGALEWITATFATAVTLAPNTAFWITPACATGSVTWKMDYVSYSGGVGRYSSTNVSYAAFLFRLLGYAAAQAASLVRCDDTSLATDGDDATITSLTVPLLSTGIPYLNLLAETSCYWSNWVLSNNTTSQTVTMDAICVDEDEIEINVGARTVKNVTTGENLLAAAKFSDPDEWIRIAPGTNTFALTETGIVSESVVIEYYDRWL